MGLCLLKLQDNNFICHYILIWQFLQYRASINNCYLNKMIITADINQTTTALLIMNKSNPQEM